MSRIIYVTNNGLATEGIVAANEPLYQSKIFIDDPENLIGFRRALKHHSEVKDKTLIEYFEIGYFMEMLYEGTYDAFRILKMSKEHIVDELYDFDILRSNEDKLLSMNLIDNLVNEAEELFPDLEDPKELGLQVKEKNNEFLIEKLAYNNKNAYICLRNLMLAEGVLNKDTFDYEMINQSVLQGVRDGRFSLSAIQDGYNDYKKKIDKLLESSNLPIRPDFEFMDQTLLEIRNVDIKSLNVARYEN